MCDVPAIESDPQIPGWPCPIPIIVASFRFRDDFTELLKPIVAERILNDQVLNNRIDTHASIRSWDQQLPYHQRFHQLLDCHPPQLFSQSICPARIV